MRITVFLVCLVLASLACISSAKKDQTRKDSFYPCLQASQCTGLKTFSLLSGDKVCCSGSDEGQIDADSGKCACRRNDVDEDDAKKGKKSKGKKRKNDDDDDSGDEVSEEETEALMDQLREQEEWLAALTGELAEKLRENQNEKDKSLEQIEKAKQDNFDTYQVRVKEIDEKSQKLQNNNREQREEEKNKYEEEVKEIETKYEEKINDLEKDEKEQLQELQKEKSGYIDEREGRSRELFQESLRVESLTENKIAMLKFVSSESGKTLEARIQKLQEILGKSDDEEKV